MRKNKQIVLAARPQEVMKVTDFALHEAKVPPLEPGQYLIQNQYLSMDAGFRKWMKLKNCIQIIKQLKNMTGKS